LLLHNCANCSPKVGLTTNLLQKLGINPTNNEGLSTHITMKGFVKEKN